MNDFPPNITISSRASSNGQLRTTEYRQIIPKSETMVTVSGWEAVVNMLPPIIYVASCSVVWWK